MPQFVFSSVIPAPVERVFAFHESPDALERLTPPWQPARVLHKDAGLRVGARVELIVTLGPFKATWRARHTAYEKNRLFVDVQESGPFRRWVHRHEFEALDAASTRLTDRIEFSLPGGPIADFFGAWLARIPLRRMFAYRHEVTRLLI
jgi:ligand-binding SRPBCC domain-containing protein